MVADGGDWKSTKKEKEKVKERKWRNLKSLLNNISCVPCARSSPSRMKLPVFFKACHFASRKWARAAVSCLTSRCQTASHANSCLGGASIPCSSFLFFPFPPFSSFLHYSSCFVLRVQNDERPRRICAFWDAFSLSLSVPDCLEDSGPTWTHACCHNCWHNLEAHSSICIVTDLLPISLNKLFEPFLGTREAGCRKRSEVNSMDISVWRGKKSLGNSKTMVHFLHTCHHVCSWQSKPSIECYSSISPKHSIMFIS